MTGKKVFPSLYITVWRRLVRIHIQGNGHPEEDPEDGSGIHDRVVKESLDGKSTEEQE